MTLHFTLYITSLSVRGGLMKVIIFTLFLLSQISQVLGAEVVIQKDDYPGNATTGINYESKCVITSDRLVTKTIMKTGDSRSAVKVVKNYLSSKHTIKMINFLISRAAEETSYFTATKKNSDSYSDVKAFLNKSNGERELVYIYGGETISRKLGLASTKLEEILKSYCSPIKRIKEV